MPDKIKVLMVCHGNICRSPMAEFVMKHLVKQAGLEENFLIDSMATSTEEIGNGPHYGTVQKLRQVGVPVLKHYAQQMRKSDYEKYCGGNSNNSGSGSKQNNEDSLTKFVPSKSVT